MSNNDVRVTLDGDISELIAVLKQRSRIKKTRDLICGSLSLLHWALVSVLAGRKIGSFDPVTKEVETFSMPILDRIGHSKQGEISENDSNS